MSTIAQKKETAQIKHLASLPSPKGAAVASLKQLPASILNRISSFASYDESLHVHSVSKRFHHLPIHTLNLNNSLITDKELIEIIDKDPESITCINLSNCKNITDLSLQHLSALKN